MRVFFIGTSCRSAATSHHNNPHPLACSSAFPHARLAHPSSSSHLTAHKHTALNASPYQQSFHPCTQGTLVHTQVALLLLLPRSARSAPPPPLAQDLHKDNAALLPGYAAWASDRSSIPSIFPGGQFGRYVTTRFLADTNLHGHRPTVRTNLPSSLNLLPTPYPSTRFIPSRTPCLPRHAH